MLKRSVSALAIMAALAACTNQPLVQPREIVMQERLQTAYHWQVIAERTTDKLLAKLATVEDFDQSGHSVAGASSRKMMAERPIYLRPLDPNMPFARAFHDLMVRELMLRERRVVSSPYGATVVNYNVQSILHNQISPRDKYHPGDLTYVTGIVAGAAFISEQWSTSHAYLGYIGIAAIADLYLIGRHWLTDAPNGEVVITAEVANEQGPIFRSADIFYVNDTDLGQYAHTFGVRPMTPMLTGAKGPAPETPMRAVRLSAR